MKKFNRLMAFMLALVMLGFATSCDDDEPTIGGGDGGDLLLADGFYLAKDGEDPSSDAQLRTATVDAPSFGAMDREGFVQGYMYLTAGSYTLVEVVDKEVVTSIGGELSTVSGEDVRNPECDADNSSYSLVSAAADGASFAVAADGLYVVAYDSDMSEIVFDQMTSVSIIGAATPGGWSADTELTGTVSAEGGSWSVEGVTLDEGEMKFRFNCRWAIDRRIDNTLDFANDNGYSFFTNYGNAIDNLLPGNEGANIQLTEYAEYTVSFSWTPGDIPTATVTKTGEAEPKPEYPEELYMVGATIGGWDWAANGVQLIPVHSNPHLFWAIVWMENGATDPGIKFAPQADWIGDFGVSGDATNGVYAKGSDNVPEPATSGYYMVVVNLETGAETIEVNEPLVYGIGDVFGAWDAATPDYLFTVDNVNKVIKFDNLANSGNIRMHTTASTFTPVGDGPAVEWWQAEFNIIDGKIEYRAGGGDQAAVAVTAGQNVSLDFSAGTGTIQ